MWTCAKTQRCYLERCCACILSADGVSIVGPHDLINPVAFERQRLLRRHHTQFLQLQEDRRHVLSMEMLLKRYMESLSPSLRCIGGKGQPVFIYTFILFNLHLNLRINCNPRGIWWNYWISRKLKRFGVYKIWLCWCALSAISVWSDEQIYADVSNLPTS